MPEVRGNGAAALVGSRPSAQTTAWPAAGPGEPTGLDLPRGSISSTLAAVPEVGDSHFADNPLMMSSTRTAADARAHTKAAAAAAAVSPQLTMTQRAAAATSAKILGQGEDGMWNVSFAQLGGTAAVTRPAADSSV